MYKETTIDAVRDHMRLVGLNNRTQVDEAERLLHIWVELGPAAYAQSIAKLRRQQSASSFLSHVRGMLALLEWCKWRLVDLVGVARYPIETASLFADVMLRNFGFRNRFFFTKRWAVPFLCDPEKFRNRHSFLMKWKNKRRR